MDFNEYIEKPRVLTGKIEEAEDKIETMRARSQYARSDPSQPPGGNPRHESIIERYVARIDELERLLPLLEAERNAICADLTLLFSELENTLQMKILCMRYVDLMTFPDIKASLKYSEQHILRLHKAGRAAAEKIYLEKESGMRV